MIVFSDRVLPGRARNWVLRFQLENPGSEIFSRLRAGLPRRSFSFRCPLSWRAGYFSGLHQGTSGRASRGLAGFTGGGAAAQPGLRNGDLVQSVRVDGQGIVIDEGEVRELARRNAPYGIFDEELPGGIDGYGP